MEDVKIAELKANLSAYLAAVRKGKTIIVCDRSTPIARLVPIKSDLEFDLRLEAAVDSAAAARKFKSLKLLGSGELDRRLKEDRADRELLP